MQFSITLADFLGIWGAFILFPLILIVPGYVIGRWTNVLGFSKGNQGLSKSLLLSVTVCPWCTYFLLRTGGVPLAGGFYLVFWVAFIVLYLKERNQLIHSLTVDLLQPRVLTIVMVGLVLGSFMLVDLGFGDHLVRMQMSLDYAKHVSVTDAVTRTGVPPVNPTFYPGEARPTFYYYFWFMMCSVVDMLGGRFVGAREAVLAGTMWCGLALVALVQVFMSRWGARIVRGLKPVDHAWGYVLLGVTGLDLLVIGLDWMLQSAGSESIPLPANIEWWNDQVVSWLGTTLWVPHHLAAFLSCMLSFMLIVGRGDKIQKREPLWAIVLGAVGLASALGMSVWIGIIAGFIMIAWLSVVAYQKEYEDVRNGLSASLLALLLALPFVLDLNEVNHLRQFPLDFTVRHFYKLQSFLAVIGEPYSSIVRTLVLPLNYGIELGFFALGGLMYLGYRKRKRVPLNREELFLMVMMTASIVFCSFIRSAVVLNDLGWRGFLFVQFPLLFFSIPLVVRLVGRPFDQGYRLEPVIRQVAIAMIFISSVGIAYETYAMRFRPFGPPGAGAVEIRKAYEWVDEHLPITAVIQHNPDGEVEYFHARYGNRQVVVADWVYGPLYGVDMEQFESTMKDVSALFLPEITKEEGIAISQRLGIEALVVKQTDAIWGEADAWVSDIKKLYESECCRVYEIPRHSGR